MLPQDFTGPDLKKVGPYLIERKLGAGGMGTVYLGRHEETGRQTAVKVLSPSLAREAGLVVRFMREIDAMKKLTNPHVVELYDHGVDGDTYFYAMEYVDGETLTARLRRQKRLGWREVIALSLQICSALKAAHDAGIIHRDLKPSNLLLTGDGRIKLTDFGVAQVFAGSKLTITGGIIGTAEYMSPEQAQGKRTTKRSDLYSLGAVMYVMLTGRPPFTGKTTLDVIHKQKYNQIDRPRLIVPDMPHWLDEIVFQLMEKDPEKRFADAYVVYRRLQEVERKLELSTGDATLGDESTRGGSPTIAVGDQSAAADPGSGTLMRDLFRAELESQKAGTELRRMFENTWVLVGLLVLLLAVVGYWMRNGNVSAVEESPSGAPTKTHWLKKSEFTTEIERLCNLAQHHEDVGDDAEAERTLSALATLLEDNPPYANQLQNVNERLGDLRKRREDSPPDASFLRAALARAEALAGGGRREESVRIWNSVIALYANDPRLAADVERARRRLAESANKSP